LIMKKLISLFIFILFFSLALSIYAQLDNISNLQSVLKDVNTVSPTPPGSQSIVRTYNGFDNFYLGVDFGEPHIVTNPRDPLNSMCAFNTNNYYVTTNGYDWTKISVGFPGFAVVGDPVLTFDSLGNAFYIQIYQNGSTYGLAVAKSTNKGVNWSAVYNAIATTEGLTDKEWICADQSAGPNSNNLYVGWRQFGLGSGMRFIRSTNGGSVWSERDTLPGNQGAYVAYGPRGNTPGGNVYFAALGNGAELFYRSTDGGQTFSNQINAAFYLDPGIPCGGRSTVKGCIRIDPMPRMAADNSYTSTRGNVYITFCSNPPGPDNADIFIVRSTDYGTTWSTNLKINDDNTITDQWLPAISVDNTTGYIYVSWMDSREDPANNLLTNVYATYSTNGGVSFLSNGRVSDVSFNPDNMRVNQGTHYYIGDYMGISAIGKTSYAVWMDARDNNLGSYVGFFPDYALTLNPTSKNIANNDSTIITVKIPATKGSYTDRVKFTASLDSLPTSGSIQLSFVNGRDSLVSYPDSIYLKVKTIGTVNSRNFKLTITGKGSSGVPVHKRVFDLYVNAAVLTVGTNRNGIVDFKVNGIQYNSIQSLVFPLNSIIPVQALSPKTAGAYQYVYVNWSDNGDTTHNVTVNGNLGLTAFYKVQYKLIVNSSVGNTFGGNQFYDSAQGFTFGVLSKTFNYNGTTYIFKGWDGNGSGSYTSPDSSGNDSAVVISMQNPVSEIARWVALIGIHNISSEIPKEYKLFQNYPNPFNPNTNIQFDIIKFGNVKITVYDLIGREVGLIVNELLQPGRYKSDFDASNLSSGVYYYKIESNDFTDIKKLVVLK
jgi:hypothetical protein